MRYCVLMCCTFIWSILGRYDFSIYWFQMV